MQANTVYTNMDNAMRGVYGPELYIRRFCMHLHSTCSDTFEGLTARCHACQTGLSLHCLQIFNIHKQITRQMGGFSTKHAQMGGFSAKRANYVLNAGQTDHVRHRVAYTCWRRLTSSCSPTHPRICNITSSHLTHACTSVLISLREASRDEV